MEYGFSSTRSTFSTRTLLASTPRVRANNLWDSTPSPPWSSGVSNRKPKGETACSLLSTQFNPHHRQESPRVQPNVTALSNRELAVLSSPTTNFYQRGDRTDEGESNINARLCPLKRPVMAFRLILPNPVEVSDKRTVRLARERRHSVEA